MIDLTWHLDKAKTILEVWYSKADALFEYAELAISIYPSNFNRKAADKYRATAIHAKAFGIVWHDRYKMMLDCHRKNL